MNYPITSTKIRGGLLFASYVALCFHFVLISGYHFGQANNNDMLAIPYLTYLLCSVVCVVFYVLLSLSNGRYVLAFSKSIVAIALLILNHHNPIALIICFFAYHFLAFADFYDYKVKVTSDNDR